MSVQGCPGKHIACASEEELQGSDAGPGEHGRVRESRTVRAPEVPQLEILHEQLLTAPT